MPRVYNRKRPYRTIFRKLSKGELFWFATNLAISPYVRSNRGTYLSGWNTTTGAPTLTVPSALNLAVVRCPQQFIGQNVTLG